MKQNVFIEVYFSWVLGQSMSFQSIDRRATFPALTFQILELSYIELLQPWIANAAHT